MTGVEINTEWKEIDVRNLIKIDKDRHFIALYLDTPFEEPHGARGIKIPSGQVINPEIKLIDESGEEYLFVHSGARGTDISNYSSEKELPKKKVYQKLLIRSDFPIKTKEILWSGYDTKDLR
ncbi:MAG: hypothetical protein ABI539_08770 [Acidobacteriota bacterium]